MDDNLRFKNEKIYIDDTEVGGIVTDNGGNVLKVIRIREDYRENGYARRAMDNWLSNCKKSGFESAYVVNVNHRATEKILKDIEGSQRVRPLKVPITVKSGPGIAHICYKIDLASI